jgi:hypothetical protein
MKKVKDSQASQIVRMILDSADHQGTGKVGILGQIMLDHASKDQDGFETDEDRILFHKMRKLKSAEDSGDLVWMDYRSWNILNPKLQEVWTERLDPLMWGGVFCTYSEFRAHEAAILMYLDNSVVVNVIRQHKNFKILCVGANAKEYNMMGVKDFETLQSLTASNMVRSYCRVKNRIIVKEFQHKDGEEQRGNSASEAL